MRDLGEDEDTVTKEEAIGHVVSCLWGSLVALSEAEERFSDHPGTTLAAEHLREELKARALTVTAYAQAIGVLRRELSDDG